MFNFLLNTFLWTFALYGLFEILKTIIYIFTYTNLKSNGIYFIVATKNQEKTIEGFIRSIVFRVLYGKEDYIKEIIVADLNSEDSTLKILTNLQKEYDILKVSSWKDCKDLIDNINTN